MRGRDKTNVAAENLDDLFAGVERKAPEPGWAPTAERDLFRRRRAAKVVPFDAAGLTVDVGDFFEPRPEPLPTAAPTVGKDLFRPRRAAKVVPFDAAGLAVDVDDLLEPRLETRYASTPAMEDLSDVFEQPPAPEPWISVAPEEAIAFDEPPNVDEPPATEARPEPGAPPESSVLLLSAELRRLAVELRNLSADSL